MTYLEIKVKELFEQVLKGEKEAPKAISVPEYNRRVGLIFNKYYLIFSDNLSIEKKNMWLYAKIMGEDILLFKDEQKNFFELKKEYKESKEFIELKKLFIEVWNYSQDKANDKELIDRVFRELENKGADDTIYNIAHIYALKMDEMIEKSLEEDVVAKNLEELKDQLKRRGKYELRKDRE